MARHADPKPESATQKAFEELQLAQTREVNLLQRTKNFIWYRLAGVLLVAGLTARLDVRFLFMLPVVHMIITAATEIIISTLRLKVWDDKMKKEKAYFATLREVSLQNSEQTMNLLATVLLTEAVEQGNLAPKKHDDRVLN